MRNSFGDHRAEPGKLMLRDDTSPWVRQQLQKRGYRLIFRERTSGPILAIEFDHERNIFMGGASNFGEDYGIAW